MRRMVMRVVSVDGRRVMMVSRVMSRRAVAVGRGRHRRPKRVPGRADGQRRRRVVRRPGHAAAVRVPLIAAAGHGVVARHDGQ